MKPAPDGWHELEVCGAGAGNRYRVLAKGKGGS
jgi:hypothetical protein